MAERLNGETFKEKAFQPGKLTLIDFYSDSCVPCKRIQSYVGADTDFPERRRTDREADRSKESGRSGRNH